MPQSGHAKNSDGARHLRSHGHELLVRLRRRHRVGVCAAVTLIVAYLLLCTSGAFAQSKTLKIGFLAFGPRFIPAWRCGQSDFQPGSLKPEHETMPYYMVGLLDQLRKLNYIEDRPENAGKPGTRFAMTLRTGTPQQIREYARQFVADRVDMIVAVATASVRIAQQEAQGRAIPVLMTGVSDPVRYGFVQSLARPGGFITGVSHQLVQGSGKRVELFKQMLPNLRRIMILRVDGYVPSEKSMIEVREVAERLNIELVDRTIKNRADIQAVMATVHHGDIDGFLVAPDSRIIANLDLILETSLAQRIPTFGIFDYMAEWGAIASYGPSALQAGARVAWYIDKIHKGTPPGSLPIEPLDPKFIINLKAAKCHGISVPFEVLSQATQIIR